MFPDSKVRPTEEEAAKFSGEPCYTPTQAPCCPVCYTVIQSCCACCRQDALHNTVCQPRKVLPGEAVTCAIAAACAAAECGRRGLAVKPRKGAALLFWSLQPDGKTKDLHSLHGGCPVIKVSSRPMALTQTLHVAEPQPVAC